MFYIVQIYGKSDQQFACVCVEAESLGDAHAPAIEYIKSQNPNLDVSHFNQTLAGQVFSITPFGIRR